MDSKQIIRRDSSNPGSDGVNMQSQQNSPSKIESCHVVDSDDDTEVVFDEFLHPENVTKVT